MRTRFVLSLMVGLGVAGAAGAQNASPYMQHRPVPRTVAFNLYKDQMLKLRSEALAQQAADGGTLTTDHRDAVQRQIDHIERVYRTRWHDALLWRN